MNIVQIAERLRSLPISILSSEDIVTILKQVNDAVPDEQHITASCTGNDIYKMFCEADAELQTLMLKDIFNSRRETLILDVILEEAGKRNLKDSTTGKKWSSVQGSIVLLGAGFLIAVLWSFFSSHAEKPIVPDAVVGNLVTEIIRVGGEMLMDSITDKTPTGN